MNAFYTILLFLFFCYSANAQWTRDGSNVDLTNPDDNVKIGDGTAANKLDVDGDIYTNNRVLIQKIAPAFWLDETDQYQKGCNFVLNNGNLQFQRRAANFGDYEASFARFFLAAPPNSFVLSSTGNIGFGIGNPDEKLHVDGNILSEGDIYSVGNTGIGTTSPAARLHVAGNAIVDGTLWTNGKIWSEEVEVVSSVTWPDYVFENDYELMKLSDLENYINVNGSLPNIPKAEEAEQGIRLGEMNAKLLQKIEELTLYIIDQQKQIDELKSKIDK